MSSSIKIHFKKIEDKKNFLSLFHDCEIKICGGIQYLFFCYSGGTEIDSENILAACYLDFESYDNDYKEQDIPENCPLIKK